MEQRTVRSTAKSSGNGRRAEQGTHLISMLRVGYSFPLKEMASIDNVMKAKLNNYNLVKGSLVQMQRKKT
jgi:hypothetical protein